VVIGVMTFTYLLVLKVSSPSDGLFLMLAKLVHDRLANQEDSGEKNELSSENNTLPLI
jgi:hypothetical protein